MKIYHLSKCPICGEKIDQFYPTSATEPFTHTEPLLGLLIWGAFSAPKEPICVSSEYVHFKFGEETRLIALNQEDPPQMIQDLEEGSYSGLDAIEPPWYDEEGEDYWWGDVDDM